MKKLILLAFMLTPLGAAAQFVPHAPAKAAYCLNPSGVWVPIATSQTASQLPNSPPASDLYGINGTNWFGLACDANGNLSAGTVTSFSAGGLSPLFTTSVATPTTTPALSFSLGTAAQNAVFAGPGSGGTGAPGYRALVSGDIPDNAANTSGTAANLSGTPALPNGTTATTQSANSADNKLATDNSVIASYATPPTAGYGSTTPAPVFATIVSSMTSVATPVTNYDPAWAAPIINVLPISGIEGYAYDGTNHYISNVASLVSYNASFVANWTNSSPFTGLTAGVSHIGDIEYSGGNLYAPVEEYVSCSSFTPVVLAVYNASTGALVTYRDITADGHEASAVAVNSAANQLYVSSFCDGSKLWVYNLSTLTLQSTISLSQTITDIQGLSWSATTNQFALTSGNSGQTIGYIWLVSPTGIVTGPIYTPASSGEMEGVDYTASDGSLRYFFNGQDVQVAYQGASTSSFDADGAQTNFNMPLNSALAGSYKYTNSVLGAAKWYANQNGVYGLSCPAGLSVPFTSSSCGQFSFGSNGIFTAPSFSGGSSTFTANATATFAASVVQNFNGVNDWIAAFTCPNIGAGNHCATYLAGPNTSNSVAAQWYIGSPSYGQLSAVGHPLCLSMNNTTYASLDEGGNFSLGSSCVTGTSNPFFVTNMGAATALSLTLTSSANTLWTPAPYNNAVSAWVPAQNQTMYEDFNLPYPLTVAAIDIRTTTADNTSNLYDIGIYSMSGTRLTHSGPIAGSTCCASIIGVFPMTGTAVILQPGSYILAYTTNCASACMVPSQINSNYPYLHESVSAGVTTGGILLSSITIGGASFNVSGSYVWFTLHN